MDEFSKNFTQKGIHRVMSVPLFHFPLQCVTWNNTFSVLSYDTSNQTPVLWHFVKRPLFTKLYNNGQRETPTLSAPPLLAYIWDFNPHKQPNQKRSVAMQLSVVALEGVLVDPSSTERRQTLHHVCLPVSVCPAILLTVADAWRATDQIPCGLQTLGCESKILYVLFIYWTERSCSFRSWISFCIFIHQDCGLDWGDISWSSISKDSFTLESGDPGHTWGLACRERDFPFLWTQQVQLLLWLLHIGSTNPHKSWDHFQRTMKPLESQ